MPAGQTKLAVHGGTPVRTKPWPPRRLIGAEERDALLSLLDAAIAGGDAPGYNGPQEDGYGKEFAASLGGGWADGVNSGTNALYVALRAAAPPAFSEVIVGAMTDPGGMMPIPLLNCIPIVADVRPDSYNTGPEQIAPLLSPLTSAIVVPHIAGEPADVPGIMALAARQGVPVIEDCAQAHGARLHGQPVGALGDLSAFSTMFGKHHCSGGQGGLVFTKREDLYQRIRRAADRGKPFFLPAGSSNCQAALNCNMDEYAAAIGRVQLRKLPTIVARRQAVAAALFRGLDGLATVAPPALLPGAEPSYWFLRLSFCAAGATCDKETFCQALSAEGLPINPSYRGALPHLMDWFVNRRVFGDSGYPWASPHYRGDPRRQFPCPNALSAVTRDFNLGIHENWGEADIADALTILHKVDDAYRRRA